jgi:hypothetical protein
MAEIWSCLCTFNQLYYAIRELAISAADIVLPKEATRNLKRIEFLKPTVPFNPKWIMGSRAVLHVEVE